MISQSFQTLIIYFFLVLVSSLVVYANYCNRRSRSYAGTGRVAEIEAWHIKATITWLLAFCISVAGVATYL